MHKMQNLCYISSPTAPIHGQIYLPGDKSISHRAVILGAISNGTTILEGYLNSADCRATITACEAMGVNFVQLTETQLAISGVGKHGLLKPKQPLDCGNSGTSMRLLFMLLAAQNFASELNGDASLRQRPMNRISIPLTLMGAMIVTNQGNPPIT